MADEERRLVRGLAACFAAHMYICCVPPTLGLTPRLGLSSWPARYPHRREMLHMTFSFQYAFVPLPLINSQSNIAVRIEFMARQVPSRHVRECHHGMGKSHHVIVLSTPVLVIPMYQ